MVVGRGNARRLPEWSDDCCRQHCYTKSLFLKTILCVTRYCRVTHDAKTRQSRLIDVQMDEVSGVWRFTLACLVMTFSLRRIEGKMSAVTFLSLITSGGVAEHGISARMFHEFNDLLSPGGFVLATCYLSDISGIPAACAISVQNYRISSFGVQNQENYGCNITAVPLTGHCRVSNARFCGESSLIEDV